MWCHKRYKYTCICDNLDLAMTTVSNKSLWPTCPMCNVINKFLLLHTSYTWLTTCMEWNPFEKLIVLQVVKKLPTLYGTWRFITILTTACHLFVSWIVWIQSSLPILFFFKIHFNIILPYACVVQGFLTEVILNYFSNPHMLCALSIILSSIWSTVIINGEEYEPLNSFLCCFVHISVSSLLLDWRLPQHPVLEHLEPNHMLR